MYWGAVSSGYTYDAAVRDERIELYNKKSPKISLFSSIIKYALTGQTHLLPEYSEQSRILFIPLEWTFYVSLFKIFHHDFQFFFKKGLVYQSNAFFIY